MKKVLLFVLLFAAITARADDTVTLQTLFNSGDCTLTAGHTYTVSGQLNVTHVVNMNNSAIVSTMTGSSLAVLRMTASGATVKNGTIQGPWDYTTPGNPGTGYYGIRVLANNCVIDNMIITQFSSYGILCGNFNNLHITNSTITKTGYIGFLFNSEANSSGGVFSNNTVDRSMLPASTIQDACVDIRGSTANDADTTFNWVITNNIFRMPVSPHLTNNECMEVRHMYGSRIDSNIFSNGRIGPSVVRCDYMKVRYNIITGAKDCGLEFADTRNSIALHNSITGCLADGILLDGGGIKCKYDTLDNNFVFNNTTSAVHLYFGTKKIVFNGGTYSNASQKVINVQQSDSLTFNNVSIDGQSFAGSYGVFYDNSNGNSNFSRPGITHCTYAVGAYSTTTGQVVDNIVGVRSTLTGTPNIKTGTFTNGAHFGTNIRFSLIGLVFPSLPTVTYGVANFPPGATSPNAITYSTSNSGVAAIVSGNIHVAGAGSADITANDGDTSIVQHFTVNKAALSITANNFKRVYRAANPIFTASYSGFVNGEDHTVLLTQPTLSTSAVLLSLPGSYTITVSGATSNNYNITNHNGTLSILSISVGGIIRHKFRPVP